MPKLVTEGENLGLSLTRRWLGAAMAAVLVVVMGLFLVAGPVHADDPLGSLGVNRAVTSMESTSTYSSVTPVIPVAESAPMVKHKATRAATPTIAPDGSPLYVQLTMIAVLIVLGVGYFKLMGHSSRRTPKAKPAETDEKQSVDA